MPSLGLGLGFARGSSFNPSSLFTSGSRGFFYDFSDYSTQFTDTAGTTAITGVGQSLARANDKSGLGNNATQATAGLRALTQVRPMFTQRNRAVGSELPENATYWPASAVQNGITMTKVASGTDTDGLPYVDVRYQGTAAGTVHDQICPFSAFVLAGAAGQQATCSFIARVIGGSTANVSGFWARVSEETAPSTFIGIALGTAVTSTADTVTSATRAITTGNQFRATLALNFTNGATIDVTYRIKGLMFEYGSARTTYQPAVSGELRNLLTFSEAFDNVSGWTSAGTTLTANTSTSPEATTTADTLTASAATSVHRVISAAATVSSGLACVHSVYLKAGTHSFAQIHDGASASYFANFNLTTGVVGTATGCTATMTSIGSGWYRCSIAMTLNAANPILCIGLVTSNTAVRNESWAAAGTETILLWGAQLELGSTYSRYQQVVTANEWYEPGFTSYRGLRFDGTDDFLQTAAIDFSNSDKMTVVAGVRKLSDAALSAVVEVGVGGGNGTAGLGAPGVGGGATYRFLSQGTIGNSANSAASFPAPDTAVITGLGDISGDSAILRRNGVQVAQNTADQGTGNFANDIVYIGRRGGTTLPFNGVLTFLCVINRTLTAGELAALEAYANSRTGAY